ncbi:Adenylate kinase [Akanthomyces lecanii RCEF 1005]|uniref:Adenylate kinase n=1 Tax=Akanthomyces lecanii RCEF 1005 TaxID=1081108 RepID=A0A168FW57_CORDF|nr:Adenylate kinase [Akanthomyces lecanii RCEF 1005]
MLAGTFAPKEVSMAIIQSHMKKASETGINLFVLDGKSDFQDIWSSLHYFESVIAPLRTVIMLQCSEAVKVDRLCSRGRFDDNAVSIRGRLATFHTTTSKVVDLMHQRGNLVVVDAEQPVETVSRLMVEVFSDIAERRV